MHRTLKEAVCQPPRRGLTQQQQAFDCFRQEYNEKRPHEALGMKTPGLIYQPSRRLFPEKLPTVEYDSWIKVRRVLPSGGIKWQNNYIYVSQALAGESVGLKQIEDTVWQIWFSFLMLGLLDITKGKVLPMPPV